MTSDIPRYSAHGKGHVVPSTTKKIGRVLCGPLWIFKIAYTELKNTSFTHLWDDFDGCLFQVGPRAKEGSAAGPGWSIIQAALSLRWIQLGKRQIRTPYGVSGSPNRKVATQTPRVLEQGHIFHRRELPAAVSGTSLSRGRNWATACQLLPTTWVVHCKVWMSTVTIHCKMVLWSECLWPPQISWNPNPQGNNMSRWDLWRWLFHEGRVFMSGISECPYKRGPEKAPLSIAPCEL